MACISNAWMLRTFSKAYSLAGLRIGYGVVSDPILADLINRLRTPFNVNHVAQAAALAALKDEDHLGTTLRHVAAERQRMASELSAMGVFCLPSKANFLFFKTSCSAETLNQALLRQGVIIKPWREAGYAHHSRVSIGSVEDNNLFLCAVLKTIEAFKPDLQ